MAVITAEGLKDLGKRLFEDKDPTAPEAVAQAHEGLRSMEEAARTNLLDELLREGGDAATVVLPLLKVAVKLICAAAAPFRVLVAGGGTGDATVPGRAATLAPLPCSAPGPCRHAP